MLCAHAFSELRWSTKEPFGVIKFTLVNCIFRPFYRKRANKKQQNSPKENEIFLLKTEYYYLFFFCPESSWSKNGMRSQCKLDVRCALECDSFPLFSSCPPVVEHFHCGLHNNRISQWKPHACVMCMAAHCHCHLYGTLGGAENRKAVPHVNLIVAPRITNMNE